MYKNFTIFLDNKRVAIVGPANSVLNTRQKSLIDNYDIIMRFNSAVPIPENMKDDIGTRTDILCNCLQPGFINGGNIDPKLWKDNGVKWLLCPYARELNYVIYNVNNFERKNKNINLNFLCVDKPFFDSIQMKLDNRPNSGLLGILYLLEHNIKEIYITGITFGRGGYCPGYKTGITEEKYNKLANSGTHQQKPQEELFKEVYKNNKNRIKIDTILEKIIMEEI